METTNVMMNGSEVAQQCSVLRHRIDLWNTAVMMRVQHEESGRQEGRRVSGW